MTSSSAIASPGHADLCLSNALIRTGALFQHVQRGSLLIGDGLIHAILPPEAPLPEGVPTVNLHGALVLPGFVDTHTHLGWAGEGYWRVDWSRARTKVEALERLRLAAGRIEPGLWLRAEGWSGGWSRERLPDAELPTLAEIDALTGSTPIYLVSADGSLALANSEALRRFRLIPGPDSALAAGGDVELGPDGQLTGRIHGAAAHARATAGALPPPDRYRRRAELKAILREMARRGITEAHDIATFPDPGPTPPTYRERSFTDATLFDDLDRAGALTARIDVRPYLHRWQDAAREARLRDEGCLVTCHSVKLLMDRSWFSADAAGGYTYRYDGFEPTLALLLQAQAAGLDVSIHAVGDLAVHETLDLFEWALGAAGRPRRHRLVHARRIMPDDVARVARLGVLAEVQPWSLLEEMPHYVGRFGEQFMEMGYPLRSLLDAGARLALGSDLVMDQRPDLLELNPLAGIYAAVTRQPLDAASHAPWQPAQRIALGEALAGYTHGAAWGVWAEGLRGRIERGLQADLAVLSRDVLSEPPEALLQTDVLLTVVAGRVVYAANGITSTGG